MRVCVLTTSYPRSADDVAGRFVSDAVEQLRAAGVEVDVVSPASFRHFGIAYGGGIVQNGFGQAGFRSDVRNAMTKPRTPYSEPAAPRITLCAAHIGALVSE